MPFCNSADWELSICAQCKFIFSAHLELASAQLLTHLQAGIDRPLQVSLQTAPKVPEHGGASRQDDVLWKKKDAAITELRKITQTLNTSDLQPTSGLYDSYKLNSKCIKTQQMITSHDFVLIKALKKKKEKKHFKTCDSYFFTPVSFKLNKHSHETLKKTE